MTDDLQAPSAFQVKGLRKLRLRANLSQPELAAKIGVTKLLLSKWERGWETPPTLLIKELAILFDCPTSKVLGRELEVEGEWWDTPFAVTEPEEPYGCLRLHFSAGKTIEYPISQKARVSLLKQMDDFNTIRDREGLRPWLYTWSMDNRILHINPRFVRKFSLVSDDEEAMPEFEHPEVYRTLEDWDELHDKPLPQLLAEGCQRARERNDGERLDRADQQWHLYTLWGDGSDEWEALIYEEDVAGLYKLGLSFYDVPAHTLITTEGSYERMHWVNLEHTALLAVPIERFHRRSAPHPRRDGDDDELWDERDDVDERESLKRVALKMRDRVEKQLESATNDNTVGTVAR